MGIVGRVRATKHNPCPLCGVTDWDMTVQYDNGDTVVFCRKVSANKGDFIIGRDGKQYQCIAVDHQVDTGLFSLFREYLPKEEWMRRKATQTQFRESLDFTKPLKFEAKVKSNKECDTFYRYLLSILVLEDKHKERLLHEWESPIHDMKHLLTDYPIRSLPPHDFIRRKLKERFHNPTRNQLIAKLVKKFGEDLSGYPGIYLRTSEYWDSRPMSERWTISGAEGILFPCYDTDGYIYRLRVKCDFPDVVIREGEHEPCEGRWGTLSHNYDANGNHIWHLFCEDGEEILAHPALNSNGVPAVGKVSGKYRTISSLLIKKEPDGSLVNGLKFGCRSGSPYSLYTQPGDNFTVVIGTEGEKKGMVSNAIKHMPVLSVSGVGCFMGLFEADPDTGKSVIDTLKEKGMKAFLLCYDADKEEKEEVMKAQNAFLKKLKEAGIQTYVGDWKSQYDKGIDDILLLGLDIKISKS